MRFCVIEYFKKLCFRRMIKLKLVCLILFSFLGKLINVFNVICCFEFIIVFVKIFFNLLNKKIR